MKKYYLFFLLLIVSSCSIFEEEDDYIYNLWASVENIEIISNNNAQLNLNIDLGIPTPCNEYYRRDITVSNDTVTIKYYSKVRKDIACSQVLSQIFVTDVIHLENNKSYLFRFWKLGDSYLDTLIVIK